MADDPQFAELRRRLLEQPASWASLPYHPRDPALVDPEIRRALELRHPRPLPSDPDKLERVAWDLGPTVFAGAMRRPEWRAAVEERVRAWWADPPITTAADGAVVADLGICPGPLVSRGRLGWSIARSDHAVDGSLRGEEVGRRLIDLRARFPGARAWQLDVLVQRPGGGAPRAHSYRYDSSWDRLAVRRADEPGYVYLSPTPLRGDLTALADGRSPTHPLKLLRSRTTDGTLVDLEGWR